MQYIIKHSSTGRSAKKSSKRGSVQEFLTELVNLRDAPDSIERFRNRFGIALLGPPGFSYEGKSWAQILNQFVLARDLLRRVWDEEDSDSKKRWVFALRSFEIYGSFEENKIEPVDRLVKLLESKHLPPPGLMDQAVYYLMRSLLRLRRCQNPDCPAPYFVAVRRNRRFCSDVCALPTQREYKRRWWDAHGVQWRKRRVIKKSNRKSQRKRGKKK